MLREAEGVAVSVEIVFETHAAHEVAADRLGVTTL
jgi:hypothetical protein